MRTIFFLTLILCSGHILGQTKTTISNGDFNDPGIWSPSGVPNLINTDSLFINHQVTFNQKLIVNWEYFRLDPAACLTSISGLDTISFIDVNGLVEIAGSLHVGWFNNQSELTVITGQVLAETQFNNLDTIEISSTAIIETYKWYCASGVSFDGQLACSYFNNNGGTIVGTGSICVSDTLRNQGFVGGTVDICDATPSGAGDYNIGTYDSGVTFCTSSPCDPISNACSATNIENSTLTEIKVYPNPCKNLLIVTGGEPESNFRVLNVHGKMVAEGILFNDTIDLSNLDAGIYFIQLLQETKTIPIIKR